MKKVAADVYVVCIEPYIDDTHSTSEDFLILPFYHTVEPRLSAHVEHSDFVRT